MTSNSLAAMLLGASACAIAAVWARWKGAAPGSVRERVSVVALQARARPASDSALADAEDVIVANDPFRLSNTAPSVRYDPVTEAAGGLGGMTTPAPRPMFVLKAIVGGPPWQAVIDGMPGEPAGIVARQGSTFNGFTVRAVTRDSVIIRGSDTTWVLSFRGRS